jgi:ubiquinone/menaquinone biosynthesis C-methylase UbiE
MSSIIFNKYQKRADNYHWQQISRNLFHFNAYVAARYHQVINLIPQNPQQKILDIGCGDGVLLSLISNGSLYGVDLDQTSLDFASTKVKAKLIQAPATKLPFKDNFFDIVLATEIIEHLTQPEKLIQEAKRVLKAGGRIILTTPVQQPGKLTDQLHVREFSSVELKELLQPYFHQITISQSHPLWLKKIYTFTLLKFGRFHLDLFRWLINAIVLSTGYNPFLITGGRSTQQVAVARK